jgi:hypothetical protein
MTQRRLGRPLAGKAPRVRIAPTVAPETVEGFDEITTSTSESRGVIIDRLIAAEVKKLRRRQG